MRRVFWILSVFTLLLLVLFLWNETIDTSLRVNDEKVSNFFTALGAIATALSLWFLYSQIVHFRESQIVANLPDLYPAATQFQTKDEQILNFQAEQPKVSPLIRRVENGSVLEDQVAYVELHNIGLGVAKNIETEWIFNKEEVNSLIWATYYPIDINASNKQSFDFLTANNKLKISPPFYYLNCCGEQLNQDLLDLIDPNSEANKPNLNLKITYSDIHNISYTKQFAVKVSALMNNIEMEFHSK